MAYIRILWVGVIMICQMSTLIQQLMAAFVDGTSSCEATKIGGRNQFEAFMEDFQIRRSRADRVRNSWIRFNYTRQSFVSNHWKLMKGYPASGSYPAVPKTTNICTIQKLGERDGVCGIQLLGLLQEILGNVDHTIYVIQIYIYICLYI